MQGTKRASPERESPFAPSHRHTNDPNNDLNNDLHNDLHNEHANAIENAHIEVPEEAKLEAEGGSLFDVTNEALAHKAPTACFVVHAYTSKQKVEPSNSDTLRAIHKLLAPACLPHVPLIWRDAETHYGDIHAAHTRYYTNQDPALQTQKDLEQLPNRRRSRPYVPRKRARTKKCTRSFDSTKGYPGEGPVFRVATLNANQNLKKKLNFILQLVEELELDVLIITEVGQGFLPHTLCNRY